MPPGRLASATVAPAGPPPGRPTTPAKADAIFAPRWIAVVDREAIPEELVAPIRPGEPACRFLAVRVLVREQGASVTLIECPLIDGHLSGERLRRTIDRDLSETRELRGSGG